MPQNWARNVQEERKGGRRLDLTCHVINTAKSRYINWLLGNMFYSKEKKIVLNPSTPDTINTNYFCIFIHKLEVQI